jgi:hypothetical protein
MARVRQASPAQRRRVAVTRRDAALERLSAITAGICVATIAAVGALGVYVAKALPGHHTGQTTGTTATSGNSGTSSGSGNSINPPNTAPQGASLPAPVTSGSS